MKMLKKRLGGFTLIELLIVVAIIAILAAIAVPNFLEAQIRSKVSRAQTDMRSMATAIESYRVDNNVYPEDAGDFVSTKRLCFLSSPIAYITNPLMSDPFKAAGTKNSNNRDNLNYIYLGYGPNGGAKNTPKGWQGKFDVSRGSFPIVNGRDATGVTGNSMPGTSAYPFGIGWSLTSYGPDARFQFDTSNDPAAGNVYMPYDSTNGTKSRGDIFRFGP